MNLLQQGFTGMQLKYIAAILMVFDHIHQMFYYTADLTWMTMLGRLVLPIFLFMCAEGYYHTRNRKKYAMRLLYASWIMTVLMNVTMMLLPITEPQIQLMNNVFSTMFLAVLVMYGVDSLKKKKIGKGIFILVLPIITFLPFLFITENTSPIVMRIIAFFIQIFPSYLTVEGGFIAVFLAASFYFFRNQRIIQYVALAIVALLSTGFNFTGLLSTNIQWMMIFSLPLIALYNGLRGTGSKYFFYIFYPTHIIILYVLAYFYINH